MELTAIVFWWRLKLFIDAYTVTVDFLESLNSEQAISHYKKKLNTHKKTQSTIDTT